MSGLQLRPGWWAWQQLGPDGLAPPWRASPIFLTEITPLKSGQGFLDLEVVMLLQPFEALRLRVRLKVVLRRPEVMIALWDTPGGPSILVAITAIDRDWLHQYCPWIAIPSEQLFYEIPSKDDAADYLNRIFGEKPDEMFGGAAAARKNWLQHRSSPRRVGVIPMKHELTGGDAYLFLKGLIPRMQEHRWFIFRDGGDVGFDRSWSGIRVWTASITRTATGLTITSLTVNRDRRQYGYGTPEQEKARFLNCVYGLLLGKDGDWGGWIDTVEPRAVAAAWRRTEAERR